MGEEEDKAFYDGFRGGESCPYHASAAMVGVSWQKLNL